MTLVDPLPEDHLLEGLVREEQANHLHWEGRGGEGRGGGGGGARERRGGGGEGRGWMGVLGRGGCRGEVGGGVQIVRMEQEEKRKNEQMEGLDE